MIIGDVTNPSGYFCIQKGRPVRYKAPRYVSNRYSVEQHDFRRTRFVYMERISRIWQVFVSRLYQICISTL